MQLCPGSGQLSMEHRVTRVVMRARLIAWNTFTKKCIYDVSRNRGLHVFK